MLCMLQFRIAGRRGIGHRNGVHRPLGGLDRKDHLRLRGAGLSVVLAVGENQQRPVLGFVASGGQIAQRGHNALIQIGVPGAHRIVDGIGGGIHRILAGHGVGFGEVIVQITENNGIPFLHSAGNGLQNVFLHLFLVFCQGGGRIDQAVQRHGLLLGFGIAELRSVQCAGIGGHGQRTAGGQISAVDQHLAVLDLIGTAQKFYGIRRMGSAGHAKNHHCAQQQRGNAQMQSLIFHISLSFRL